MIIKIRQGVFDTDTLSYAELVQLKEMVQDAAISMKSKQEEVKLKAFIEKEYASPEWFRRLNYAMRIHNKYLQFLNQTISAKKKEENIRQSQEEGKRFDREFFLVCKESLDPRQFSELIKIAHERIEENDQT